MVSCGCLGATESPIERFFRSLDTAEPTCGNEESVSILSDSLRDTEGCYFNTAEFNNESPVYTSSGTMDLGQVWIVAAEYTDEEGIVSVSGTSPRGGSHTGGSDWGTGQVSHFYRPEIVVPERDGSYSK